MIERIEDLESNNKKLQLQLEEYKAAAVSLSKECQKNDEQILYLQDMLQGDEEDMLGEDLEMSEQALGQDSPLNKRKRQEDDE